MREKFKAGDKVDFVNDAGILFRGFRVKARDKEHENQKRYFLEGSDTPWYSFKEENLYPAGTYVPKNMDITLKNGKIAKFLYYDENYNKIFSAIDTDGFPFNMVYVDGIMHSYSLYGEPSFPLKESCQPVVK